MIDTHSHIYLPRFRDDLAEVLDRAVSVGITDIMMPAIDIDSLAQMDEMHHPGIRFHKMAGIHPCDVRGDTADVLELLPRLAESPDIIAVGETGLDYHWSTDFVNEQKESLRFHCRLARETGKPVILHNRESTDDLLDIVEDEQDGNLNGVWHCFNGTESEARRALDLNLYLGIGGVVTFKNAGVDRVVAGLPTDRLLLETDAPYLAPVPKRGKRNEPAYLAYTAEKLAEIFGWTPDEADRVTTENARRLFGLP
ncbi:TatD family hydrolase [Balneolales bacterium ANBcel1]|nr:TatD family hydrolase [Balneolales bacterium ANBcel1]